MFAFYNRHNNSLYNKLVELSRNLFFYKELGLKDNFETRIILIFMHFSIIINLHKNGKFSQKIFDNIFQNIEYHLRELGYGDVTVNKKMKILNKIFYDILLKIEDKTKKSFTINEKIITEHFKEMNIDKSVFIGKMGHYLVSFHNFCFELDHNSMLKGQINFKY
jgi:cytochrome b pre-mRNA-processing protein 3